jgi:hypothetical protein
VPRRIVHQLPAARADHRRLFGLVGEGLLVEANDPRLIAAAESAFGRFPVPAMGEPLVVTLLLERARGVPVDATRGGDRNGSGPSSTETSHRFDEVAYRAHGTTVLIAGREHDAGTIDLAAGRALAYVGEAALEDPRGLRYAFIEAMAYWMLAYTRGYLTLHASGVARDGVGVILEGPAGAGKSTVAVAAARRGRSVFAEDAVFARIGSDGLELWGAPWVQRLLPDAAALFPELASVPVLLQPNGERKLEVDLSAWYPGTATPMARPGALVSLLRAPGERTELIPIGEADDGPEFLWPYDLDWRPAQHAVAAAIEALPAYRLVVGGGPDDAVDAIDGLLAQLAAGAASVA